MNFIKSEEKGTNQHVIEFSIAKDTFDAEVTKIFRERVKNITVPGFRKGKAPRAIIEKMYGKGVFYEDALNNLLPAEYDAAAKESGLDIVSRPEIDVEEIGDNGVIVKASVWTKPVLSIKDYKGIEVSRFVVDVTEDEVNGRINSVRERNARIEDVTDRAAKDTDIVNIDYEGFCDGVAFEGGKGEGQELTLGSGTFIPGFEDQIVGKTIGEEFDVNVTFPKDYHAENLAGKEAVFKCKLNGIKEKLLPALDDEFAKDVSEFNTYSEYLADVKAKLDKEHKDHADAEVDEKLIGVLLERLEGEIPHCMIDTEAENLVRDYDMRLRSNGLSLSDYMKYTGKDLNGLREEMHPQAEKQVRTRLALERIAELESISATDEQINAEIARIAELYHMEKDKVTEYVSRDNIKKDVEVEAAMKLVRDSAKITDKKPETDDKKPEAAKPAKKTTARKTTKKAAEEPKAEPEAAPEAK